MARAFLLGEHTAAAPSKGASSRALGGRDERVLLALGGGRSLAEVLHLRVGMPSHCGGSWRQCARAGPTDRRRAGNRARDLAEMREAALDIRFFAHIGGFAGFRFPPRAVCHLLDRPRARCARSWPRSLGPDARREPVRRHSRPGRALEPQLGRGCTPAGGKSCAEKPVEMPSTISSTSPGATGRRQALGRTARSVSRPSRLRAGRTACGPIDDASGHGARAVVDMVRIWVAVTGCPEAPASFAKARAVSDPHWATAFSRHRRRSATSYWRVLRSEPGECHRAQWQTHTARCTHRSRDGSIWEKSLKTRYSRFDFGRGALASRLTG